MAELGLEMLVYVSDESGNYRTTTVRELLPDSFSRASLVQA
jgi:cytidine deaminase